MRTPAEKERNEKKEYQSPELVEWGNISDLTQGSAPPGVDGAVGGSNQ